MNENEINIPEIWDKDYITKLENELRRFLERFFYDGPFDEESIMKSIMTSTKGKINPKQAQKVVQEFLRDYKD